VPCYRCDRVQTDPVKGASPWAVGVRAGEQILVCPDCQARDPGWSAALDECSRCGGTRLRIMVGTVVCRGCGHEEQVAR
jgi:ribosomal protein L40E